MHSPRLTALGLAVAGALNALPLAAATNAELEARLLELTQKVSQLEAALAASRQPAPAPAATVPDPALAQKVAVLERKLEIADEEAAKAKIATPVVTANEKGFALTSFDKAFELKVRGYFQSDGRFVYDDVNETFSDTFTLRRVRPIFEATLYKYYALRFMPDFGGGATSVQDLHIEANWVPGFRLRAGKFKSPFSLERLQSATDLRFVERSIATGLMPNRDIGVMLHGDLGAGALSWAAGYFNGAADGASVSDADVSDDKGFTGRLFAHPFSNRFGPLQGLGVGIAVSYAEDDTSGDVGRVRSPAQQTFFRYREGNPQTAADTVIANGRHIRYSPQGYWYFRNFGILGEYVRSEQDVEIGADRDRLEHDAWQIAGAWLITGEEESYKGVTPKAAFDPWNGTWGALELVARYQEVDLDDDAFPIYASATSSATFAESWGVGLNWWWNRNFKVAANYERTLYTGGAANRGDRPTEHAFLTRFQIAY